MTIEVIVSVIKSNPPASVVEMEEHEMYRTLYQDITDNGIVLQYHDRHLLGELAVTLVEMNRLRADLRENGESLELQGDRNMVTKKNPARDALEKLRPAALRIMKAFKMAPDFRGNVLAPPKEKADDGFDEV